MEFKDRADAGRRLAARLRQMPREGLVVLGLPRGGVPVAFEVARRLRLPLDVIVVRKLGAPFQPELAMGAVGEEGVTVLNEDVARLAGITESEVDRARQRELVEVTRRARRFRGARTRVPLAGRTALIVDDGIATGSTVRAACKVAHAHGARRIVVATPVAPAATVASLLDDADDVVVLHAPDRFSAVGQFYGDFAPTGDDEVVHLLAVANRGPSTEGAPDDDPPDVDKEVVVRAGKVSLAGRLTVPQGANAVVVFAHGAGSGRHSARNRFVASVLNRAGIGSLLFDLLTPAEVQERANVFDIPLLARRLVEATTWLRSQPDRRDAAIGYFGASTGAGAALWAASEPGVGVRCIVSRGGRPDLAAPRLGRVDAPTLLIVGGDDQNVLELNREAQANLRCETRLSVVPGASHLFAEPGTLEQVADLARDWFDDHLGALPARPRDAFLDAATRAHSKKPDHE